MALNCKPMGTFQRKRPSPLTAARIGRLQTITYASHAPNQIALFVPQFLAKVAYMYVDNICVAEVVISPHSVQDYIPGEDLARMAQEKLQHIELAGRKLHGSSGARDPARLPVQRHIAQA